jgi:hypothetical protein
MTTMDYKEAAGTAIIEATAAIAELTNALLADDIAVFRARCRGALKHTRNAEEALHQAQLLAASFANVAALAK